MNRLHISGLTFMLLAFAMKGNSLTVQTSVIEDNFLVAVIPFMSGNEVIYQDFISLKYNLKKVNTETGVSELVRDNGSSYLDPLSFSGSNLAWVGFNMGGFGGGGGGGGGGQVPDDNTSSNYYVKALKMADRSEKQISQNSFYIECLASDNNRIIWTDYRYYDSTTKTVELYSYESSETRLTNRSCYKSHPFVRGENVVWQDYRNVQSNNNADIYMYNFQSGTETAICTNSAYQDYPSVYGNFVAWQDYRNAGNNPKNADIYALNVATGKEIVVCDNPAYQAAPKIYGNFIVWQDYRNATGSDTLNTSIYLYDLVNGTEHIVTNAAGFQSEPEIYGNNVVWYSYPDNSMYCAQISTPLFVITNTHVSRNADLIQRWGFDLMGRSRVLDLSGPYSSTSLVLLDNKARPGKRLFMK